MILARIIKEQKPCIYVCAPLAAEIAVREVLLEIFKDVEANPQEYLDTLKKNNKYIKELWG